jgi:glycosyltransferase involved in cell wall biosynthesis
VSAWPVREPPLASDPANRRRLTIAIVCDGIGDVIAGSFISTARFSERLASLGHRVLLISSGSRRNHRERQFRGMTIHRLFGVLVPWSDGQLYLAIPSSKRLRTILRDEHVDVVHVMVPMPLGLVVTRIAKGMGLPVVLHSHTQPENIFMNATWLPGRRGLTHRFFRYLNWIYRQADMMVYPSDFARRQFPELATRPHVVISNGVDRHRFRPTDPDPFMQRHGLSKSDLHLLYVGRLHREKNVETLIRAMPLLRQRQPRAHLSLVGLGYELPMLTQLARRNGAGDSITFCGFVPDYEMAAAYSACDLFVLPSIAELEGMAVLEAMATGKPLLIADSPDSAATDFVAGNGLLFAAAQPESLAEQANRLLSDLSQLRAMGAASLAKSQSFDIVKSTAALEATYYSLLATA